MKTRVTLALLALVGLVALAPAAPAGASSRDDGSSALLSAELQAYAYRVEYDLPLPAGTGSVAEVAATAQRSAAIESSHGLAAAPSHLDAVVGGKYADPQGSGHPINQLPQVECNFPSSTPTSVFRWPTETQPGTSGVPATSYAYTTCGDGPHVEAHAHGGDPADPQAAKASADTAGAIVSDGTIAPDHGMLVSKATSSAQGLSFAGGALRIGSVTASGMSATAGTPGSAVSTAAIVISDIEAGGAPFSLTFSGSSVNLTVAGATLPVDSAAAQAVLAGANKALAGNGCSLDVVSDPARYPQGFLFSRPQPELGVRDDGSLAASNRGGLLVVCDVPDNPVAQATQFSPERFQALVGFVYTSVAAKPDTAIGGFGLGDLGGGSTSGVTTLGSPVLPAVPGAALTPVAATATAAPAATGTAPKVAAPARDTEPTVLTTFLKPLPGGVRWGLGLAFLALWAWLTHLGVTRLLATGGRGAGR